MSRNDFTRLFDQLDSLTVGFGPVFRDFQVPTNNYPPHNIVKISDNEFYLELAVAGFKKDEMKMEEHQGLLTITGDKNVDPDSAYQYRGIAGRSFSKSFRIWNMRIWKPAWPTPQGRLTTRCLYRHDRLD